MFIKKLYIAIFKIEDYIVFLVQKVSNALNYLFKLTFVLSIILTACILFSLSNEIKYQFEKYEQIRPDFEITDGTLSISDEMVASSEEYIKFLNKHNIFIQLDDSSIEDYANEKNIKNGIVIGKSNIYLIENDGVTSSYTPYSYELIIDIANQMGTYQKNEKGQINKNSIISFEFYQDKLIYLTIAVAFCSFIMAYMVLLITQIFGVIFITLVSNLISYIVSPKMKFDKIFILVIYASTLGYILQTFVYCYNVLTNDTIAYSDLLYYGITFIYVVAIFYLLKHDFLTQLIKLDDQLQKLDQEEIQKQIQRELDEKRKVQEKDKQTEEEEKQSLKDKLKDSGKKEDVSSVISELERQKK